MSTSKKNLPQDFNPQEYLDVNPDVKLAGVNPEKHYLEFGLKEGRPYKKDNLPQDFNPEHYLALNLDLKLNQVSPIEHFIKHGKREGRQYHLKSDEAMGAPIFHDVYNQDGLRSIHNHDFMINEDFKNAYSRGVKATGFDYLWHWRVHIGLWAAQTATRVTGDFVECGVNKGFLSSSIMELLDWNSWDRTYYLLDTFSGVAEELCLSDENKEIAKDRSSQRIESGFYTNNVEEVKENFSQWERVKIIQGIVPNTLSEVDSTEVAFLHIDMNAAEPEIAAIDFFWNKISIGGIILLDDYAFFGYQKQKEAMDSWAKQKGISIASLPTGQGLIVKN